MYFKIAYGQCLTLGFNNHILTVLTLVPGKTVCACTLVDVLVNLVPAAGGVCATAMVPLLVCCTIAPVAYATRSNIRSLIFV